MGRLLIARDDLVGARTRDRRKRKDCRRLIGALKMRSSGANTHNRPVRVLPFVDNRRGLSVVICFETFSATALRGLGSSVFFLSGLQLVLKAAIGDGHTFDALALGKNSVAASEIDIGRRQVLQAFMSAGLVVVGNEGFDALFEFAGQKSILKKDTVLHGLMPALDLELCLNLGDGAK